MAQVPDCLKLQEDDVKKLVVSGAVLGHRNVQKAMMPYIYGRQRDGTFVFAADKLWAKLVFAARILAAVDDPADIAVVAGRPDALRAVHKFCRFTGATSFAGRFTPGTFTNRISPAYREPRVIIVNDPVTDRQAILESAYANIPIIAFCNSDAQLRFVDVAVPGNNKSPKAIGLMYWFLAREVLRLKGSLSRETEWDVKPDLFVALSPEDLKRMDEPAPEAAPEDVEGAEPALAKAPDVTDVAPIMDEDNPFDEES